MKKRVVTVTPQTPIRTLFKTMSQKGIMGFPVVDAVGRVAGVVTESDLITHFTTLRVPRAMPFLGSLLFTTNLGDFNRKLKEHCAETVGELMRSPAVTLPVNATLQEAINLMDKRGINRLPIVAKGGKLAGLVTRWDVVRALSKLKSSRI